MQQKGQEMHQTEVNSRFNRWPLEMQHGVADEGMQKGSNMKEADVGSSAS